MNMMSPIAIRILVIIIPHVSIRNIFALLSGSLRYSSMGSLLIGYFTFNVR